MIGAIEWPDSPQEHGDTHRERDPGARPREVGAFTGEWLVGFEDRAHRIYEPSNIASTTATSATMPIPIERTSGMRDGTSGSPRRIARSLACQCE